MSYHDDDERLRVFSASSWSLALRKRSGFKRVKNALRAFGIGGKRRPTISMPVLHDEMPRPSAAWEMPYVPPVPAVPDGYRREGESPHPEGQVTRTLQVERITNERDKHPRAPPNGHPTGHHGSDIRPADEYPRSLTNDDTNRHINGPTNGPTNGHANDGWRPNGPGNGSGHEREATFGYPTPRSITPRSNVTDRAQTVYSRSDVGAGRASDVGTGTRNVSGNHTVRRKPVPILHGEFEDDGDAGSDIVLSTAPGAFPDHRPLMRARSVPHRPDGRPMGAIGTSLPPPPRKRR
jgi:hypothetical protein